MTESDESEVYMVECVKLGKRMPGLKKPPLKGEIGQKIYENISQDAWRQWIEHSKMLVNEFRLDLMSETGQKVWFSELEKYFWGDGSTVPEEFVAMTPEQQALRDAEKAALAAEDD